MSKLIQELEQEQLRTDLPLFTPGDTVCVWVNVKEGSRDRAQAFEGVVIAIKNRGINSSFTVRKISHGEGVERTFQTHSPLIERVEIKRRGQVRKAKLYYLRERQGRSARIREDLSKNAEDVAMMKSNNINKNNTKKASDEQQSSGE